ncbi:hypothetical protein BpHYR1_007026 [Brachionus plicatilis]|uniref:Uncharacterized protein n=1 Tax=Brachionus plicatilis TaxID=10195 RepID=A0A3M7RJI3_BRAPC|nr:hypothetical protein BpHYR1_007026 [Brachionus plicatilis]
MVCSIVFYNNFTYNFENAFKKCDVSNLFFKKIFGESKDIIDLINTENLNSMKKWSDIFRLTGQNRSSWYILKLKNHT